MKISSSRALTNFLGFTMPSPETSSLPRRALNLSAFTMVVAFVFPFLECESTPKLTPAPIRCPQISRFAYSEAFRRLVPFGEFDTTSQAPPWIRTRTRTRTLILFSQMFYWISLFPAPCAALSGVCEAHLGLLALSSAWFSSSTTPGFVRDKPHDAWNV